MRSSSLVRGLSPAFAFAAIAIVSSSVNAAPAPPDGPAAASSSLAPIEPHDTCQRQAKHAKFRITLDREARLVDLVRWMSSVTCTKFIWSPGIRDGKVTVVSPEAVTMDQAYGAFYAALETMGLTVEESGEYLKIIESKDAEKRVIPIYDPNTEAPERDRFVTQLYRPHQGRVDDVVAVAQHLASTRAAVTAIGDLVIITDTGSSIARMLDVIERVDTPPSPKDAIFLVPLSHADPEEVANVVREVFMDAAATRSASPTRSTAKTKTKAKSKAPSTSARASASGGDPATARVTAITIDARTRTLIITAPRLDFPVVARLIERLDTEIPDDGGTLFVLPLKHADPEEIAAVLGSLTSGSGRQDPKGGTAQTQAPSNAGVSIGGEIQITADPSTRSLVVMASPADFLALRRVVEALDVERKLVYVEAYILELSTSTTLDAGASMHFGQAADSGTAGFVSSSPGGSSSALLDTSILSGLAAGVVGPSAGDILGIGQDIPSFGVLIQALAVSEDINLVSDPHLYTSDNKKARMSVGKNIPVPTGTNTFNGGVTPVTQTNYAREEVALDLEVTPHVGEGGALTLDILIENKEVGRAEFEGGPNTTTRELELEAVIARDGQPVVLGGLVQEKEEVVERRVPGLGKIPLFGWLFKNRSRSREKVNLLVILVPHILDSPDDARRIHQRRLAERREMLERETAFKRRDLQTHVNYRRTSGLLAAVQAEAQAMTQEAEFRTIASEQINRRVADQIAPDGVYELTHPPAATEPHAPVAGP